MSKGIVPGRYWPCKLNWPEELGILPLDLLEREGKAKAEEDRDGFVFIDVFKAVSAELHDRAVMRAWEINDKLISDEI